MKYINDKRPRALLEELKITHNVPTSDTVYDESWSLEKFKKRFKIVIVRYSGMEMEFDLIGIHPFLVNAFRRILLCDVPSMAIEKVHIFNNTSIIQDEVLVSRLGLIPLKADARYFEYLPEGSKEYSEQNCLEYELKVKCTWNKEAQKDASKTTDIYKNNNVYSGDIKWCPIGNQAGTTSENKVKPMHDDILIAKLRPGHEIDVKLIAAKGIGRDHAKFNPVATAFYRMLPDIKLVHEVTGADAERLQKCFSPGVIKLEGKNGNKRAVVADARYDMDSKNIYRYDDLKEAVVMTKIKDHFIFTIESVGAQKPDILFKEAVKGLKSKCLRILEELSN